MRKPPLGNFLQPPIFPFPATRSMVQRRNMTKSLGEHLGVIETKTPPVVAEGRSFLDTTTDNLSAKEFAALVVHSHEFKRYIVNGLTIGDIPPAILCRLMDYAWGKPTERVEHTGKDGAPIETITEVRRVLVSMPERVASEDDDEDASPVTRH